MHPVDFLEKHFYQSMEVVETPVVQGLTVKTVRNKTNEAEYVLDGNVNTYFDKGVRAVFDHLRSMETK